jgi:hypothetical protein
MLLSSTQKSPFQAVNLSSQPDYPDRPIDDRWFVLPDVGFGWCQANQPASAILPEIADDLLHRASSAEAGKAAVRSSV